MSDIVNTDVAPFCHGPNHSGGISITSICESAVQAPEVPLVQSESPGSRETPAARHCRVRGPDHHHPPARPPGTLDQFPFWRTDRGVSGFARHRGLRQELRPEILDSDQIVVVDNMFGPHPRVVHGLPGGFPGQPGSLPPDIDVATRGRTALAVTSGHSALRLRQFGGAAPAVTPARVLQRRQRPLAGLHLRTTTPLHREGLLQRPRIITQHLLLRDLRTLPQPQHRRSRPGEQLREPRERRLAPGFLLVDSVVPEPSAAAPFGEERFLSGASGPKPVRVPHHLIHSNILSKAVAMRHKRHIRLFLAAVNHGVSKADPR